MADVFISYSKADWLLAETLAANLEAAGWSVWWDRGLNAGEYYREEIGAELRRARAVVVIWTTNSIASEWVRAEAGQARAVEKLIPLKTAEIGYDQIPLPFGELQTQPLDSFQRIKEAITSQLTKPQLTSSGLVIISASMRNSLLMWFGVVGIALTLFSGLRGVLTLADWAKVLVEFWHQWLHDAWTWLLHWVGLVPPRPVTAAFSFALFGVSLAVAARRDANATFGQWKSLHSVAGRLDKEIGLLIVAAAIAAFAAYGSVSKIDLGGPFVFTGVREGEVSSFGFSMSLIIFLIFLSFTVFLGPRRTEWVRSGLLSGRRAA